MSAAALTAALDSQLSSDFRLGSFRKLRPRLWVSFQNEPIRQVVQFFPVRHYAYMAGWGFALTFCPTLRSDGTLAWKRTEKATRWDLWVDPHDNPGLDLDSYRIAYDGMKWDEFGRMVAVAEPQFDRVKEVCHAALGQAAMLFSSVTSYDDLADRFEEIPSRKSRRFGPDNYVPHGLAWGLTLIAAGKAVDGARRIQVWCERNKVRGDDRVLLASIALAESCSRKPEYMQ